MARKRKILFIIIVIPILIALGIFLRLRVGYSYYLKFSQLATDTSFTLNTFSKIDKTFIEGKLSETEYMVAWVKLNESLKRIDIENKKLGKPPEELKELVGIYREGLSNVLGVSNNIVNYLSGETLNLNKLAKDRQKLVEGIVLLKAVQVKLSSYRKPI